jgi:hypothetical protein
MIHNLRKNQSKNDMKRGTPLWLTGLISVDVRAFLIENHVLYYIAAATTVIAGILHLIMIGPSLKPVGFPMELLLYTDGLFLISGIAQIFWAIPMALNWNIRWFYAGLIGTVALASLIVLTRVPNEITGVALQDKNPMALLTEVMQTTFVLTTLTIILNKKGAIFRLATRTRI